MFNETLDNKNILSDIQVSKDIPSLFSSSSLASRPSDVLYHSFRCCNDLTLQRPRGLEHAPQLARPLRGHGLVPAPDTHAADEDPRHGPAPANQR